MSDHNNTFDFPAYLASLAHDMKNSLSMLLSTTDELLNRCSVETCPSYDQLSKLQYEAKRVNSNLILLLTLYKMDKSQLNLSIDYHSVAEFLEESLLGYKPLLDFRGIHIEVDCPEDLSWFFDRDLVSGVVNNVLNNISKYTKNRIRIRARRDRSGFLAIHIEDNGTGYPEHMINMVPSAPLDTSFATGSTGLGIYFASQVLKLHKNKDREGYVAISNEGIDGGGKFSIYLP